MIFPTLYSIDSKNKIREWGVHVDGDKVVVTHGLFDGKKQEKVTVCSGKNIGKANETTPEEQAILEANSKWTHQVLREDYAETPEDSGKQLRPMLALDYRKVPHRVVWEDATAQPKLDGLRLTAGRRWVDDGIHEMMTRKGEVYQVPHINEPSKAMLSIVNELCGNTCQALDGEAYIHGMPLQKITSLARKYQKGKTEKLKFYIFDLVIRDMPFIERHKILTDAYKIYCEKYNNEVFEIVGVDAISSDEDMKLLHGKYIVEGYEGLMIRHKSGMYDIAKRSPNLFKYKEFFEDEALITDVWEDANGNAMLTVKQKNGKFCDVTPKRTHDERKEMLNDSTLVGKWITVKYQAFTEDDIFQFPVGMSLRECDENGEPLV